VVAGGAARGSGLVPEQGGRARISVRPGAGSARGRAPFAILIVLLLTAGLLGLLMLNTALSEGSFQLTKLQKQTTEMTDQQQTLQQQIAQQSGPDALEKRARDLGMVPGGDPAFLHDDGKVVGKPTQAQDSPPVKRSGNDLWQQPSSAAPATPAASPSGDPLNLAPLPATATPSAAAGGTR
jgi:cell division protein FtsB